MTYFHTGIRTIIGAEAFHCPVRDGKEWDHLANVTRHKLVKFAEYLYSTHSNSEEAIHFHGSHHAFYAKS